MRPPRMAAASSLMLAAYGVERSPNATARGSGSNGRNRIAPGVRSFGGATSRRTLAASCRRRKRISAGLRKGSLDCSSIQLNWKGMCGIAGFVALAPSPRRETLVRMTQAIAHRGPDDSGFYVDEWAALGHRRLSIIDLSGGHQPS